MPTPPFLTSRQHAHVKEWRQRLIFWVFVAGEFDRRTDNGIIIIDNLIVVNLKMAEVFHLSMEIILLEGRD